MVDPHVPTADLDLSILYSYVHTRLVYLSNNQHIHAYTTSFVTPFLCIGASVVAPRTGTAAAAVKQQHQQ